MEKRPSPSVKRAAWKLLAFVRQSIKHGVESNFYSLTRPAQLHDELRHFLDVWDADAKYRPKAR